MQVSWSNASLTHTLSGATEPYDSQGARRFHFNGPDIRITSGAVIALAMTLNELCTNTTKFGALSSADGRVEIAWTIDEEKQRLRLTWTEKGGPAVQRPTRRSFGTRMMESLGQQLNGARATHLRSIRICLFPGRTAQIPCCGRLREGLDLKARRGHPDRPDLRTTCVCRAVLSAFHLM